MKVYGFGLFGLLLSVYAACGPESAADRGQELASDVTLSPSPSNLFACTTCHATENPQEGKVLSGYTLVGAAARPTFWSGKLNYLLDAVNECFVEFMRADKLPTDDPQGLALLAYLKTLAPGPDAARPCTVVPNIDSTYLGTLPAGDPGRGASSYQSACSYCHGAKHSGDGRLGTRVSIIPDETIAAHGAQAFAVMVEKVRHGKFFGVAGNMPFFCTEVLSDAELADILSYLLQ